MEQCSTVLQLAGNILWFQTCSHIPMRRLQSRDHNSREVCVAMFDILIQCLCAAAGCDCNPARFSPHQQHSHKRTTGQYYHGHVSSDSTKDGSAFGGDPQVTFQLRRTQSSRWRPSVAQVKKLPELVMHMRYTQCPG